VKYIFLKKVIYLRNFAMSTLLRLVGRPLLGPKPVIPRGPALKIMPSTSTLQGYNSIKVYY
jgi:hypothetical protein